MLHLKLFEVNVNFQSFILAFDHSFISFYVSHSTNIHGNKYFIKNTRPIKANVYKGRKFDTMYALISNDTGCHNYFYVFHSLYALIMIVGFECMRTLYGRDP